MKLIFEMVEGIPYLYLETEKHFKQVESQRVNLVTPEELDDNCNLDSYGENFHIIFELKE